MLSQLIRRCIEHVHATGVKIRSLTLDALSANIAACQALGCTFTVDNMKPNFQTEDGETVHVFLDICHTLKLFRNLLGSSDLRDKDGGLISFDHFRKLFKLQSEEGQHLGNRLTARHINYENHKMSTALAAQTISRYNIIYGRDFGNLAFFYF